MKTKQTLAMVLMASTIWVAAAISSDAEEPLDLGTADDFVILAKSGISTVPDSDILGDMGVSPIDAGAITGFDLILDESGKFSTSAQVAGNIYAANYVAPTPAEMTKAISDMEAAYTAAAGRTDPDTIDLEAGNIGGLTINPGLHKWNTAVNINTSVTLDAQGDADAIFIFQIEDDLILANDQSVILAGSAQAKNIFWQVKGGAGATIGTSAHFEGVILTATAITLQTDASFNGKLLAQTRVDLDQNTIMDSNLIQFTLAVISAVRSRIEDGVAVISWDVELEMDTAGYYLERETDAGWIRINAEPLPALFLEPAPKTYELADPDAPIASVQRYRIIELERSGAANILGPYTLALDGGEVSYATWAAGIDWGSADSAPDADPDGDGMTNFQEYLAGTDPLSANCVLQIHRLRRTSDGLQIIWKSRPDRVYAVQLSQSPSHDFMTVAIGIEAGDGTETSLTLPLHDSTASRAFFRVILVK